MCSTLGAATLTLCPAQGQPAPLVPSKTKSSGAKLPFNIFLWKKKKKEKKFFWQILTPLKYSNTCYKPEYVLQYILSGAVPLPVLTFSLIRLPILRLFTPRFSKVHVAFKVNSLNSPKVSRLRAGADS